MKIPYLSFLMLCSIVTTLLFCKCASQRAYVDPAPAPTPSPSPSPYSSSPSPSPYSSSPSTYPYSSSPSSSRRPSHRPSDNQPAFVPTEIAFIHNVIEIAPSIIGWWVLLSPVEKTTAIGQIFASLFGVGIVVAIISEPALGVILSVVIFVSWKVWFWAYSLYENGYLSYPNAILAWLLKPESINFALTLLSALAICFLLFIPLLWLKKKTKISVALQSQALLLLFWGLSSKSLIAFDISGSDVPTNSTFNPTSNVSTSSVFNTTIQYASNAAFSSSSISSNTITMALAVILSTSLAYVCTRFSFSAVSVLGLISYSTGNYFILPLFLLLLCGFQISEHRMETSLMTLVFTAVSLQNFDTFIVLKAPPFAYKVIVIVDAYFLLLWAFQAANSYKHSLLQRVSLYGSFWGYLLDVWWNTGTKSFLYQVILSIATGSVILGYVLFTLIENPDSIVNTVKSEYIAVSFIFLSLLVIYLIWRLTETFDVGNRRRNKLARQARISPFCGNWSGTCNQQISITPFNCELKFLEDNTLSGRGVDVDNGEKFIITGYWRGQDLDPDENPITQIAFTKHYIHNQAIHMTGGGEVLGLFNIQDSYYISTPGGRNNDANTFNGSWSMSSNRAIVFDENTKLFPSFRVLRYGEGTFNIHKQG